MSQKSFSFMKKTDENMQGDIEEEKNLASVDMGRGEDTRNRASPTSQANGELSPPRSMAALTAPVQSTVGKRGRKTDREREEQGGRREWTDTEITILIALWRDNDILYDTNHPLYYVQSERRLIMEYISKEMGISPGDVNDKMHSLRTYYCSQRQRTEALDSKGGNSRSFPRWKFYDQMSFLYESVTNRAAKSSLSSSRRGRKPRIESKQLSPKQSQSVPYTMMHLGTHADYSPPSQRSDHSSRKHDRNYFSDDKYELQNGHPRRVLPTYPPTNNQALNSPTSSEGNPRKRHFSDDLWPDMPQQKEQNVSPSPKEGGTAVKTIEIPQNTADEIFGHMVACSLAQVKDEQEKELLKLEIQKLIYKTRFKTENGQ